MVRFQLHDHSCHLDFFASLPQIILSECLILSLQGLRRFGQRFEQENILSEAMHISERQASKNIYLCLSPLLFKMAFLFLGNFSRELRVQRP